MSAVDKAPMKRIKTSGAFEVAPKKGSVSLRCQKQLAMPGPKTNDRFELGIKLKEGAGPLLKPVKPDGMCQCLISLHLVDDIDEGIFRRAYDAAVEWFR